MSDFDINSRCAANKRVYEVTHRKVPQSCVKKERKSGVTISFPAFRLDAVSRDLSIGGQLRKKGIFFLFYIIPGHFPIHKAGGENAKKKLFENTKNFGTTFFFTF